MENFLITFLAQKLDSPSPNNSGKLNSSLLLVTKADHLDEKEAVKVAPRSGREL